jgi:hypothetical protein
MPQPSDRHQRCSPALEAIAAEYRDATDDGVAHMTPPHCPDPSRAQSTRSGTTEWKTYRASSTRELATRLTPEPEPGINRDIRCSLADALSAEGWRIAAAKRLHGPSREFVKLVHLGTNEPVLITKTTWFARTYSNYCTIARHGIFPR